MKVPNHSLERTVDAAANVGENRDMLFGPGC